MPTLNPPPLNMEPISFEDMYGLALIAKKPNGVKLSEILEHLSPEAREIAKALMKRVRPQEETPAAKDDATAGTHATRT